MGVNLQLRKLADRAAGPDKDGNFPLAGVRLVGEAPQVHAFRYAYMFDAAREGWAEISGERFVMHLEGGDLSYRIVGQWDNRAGVHVELEQPPAKPARAHKEG